jgi:hypothetical protein
MIKLTKTFTRLSYYQKILGIFMIALGIPMLIFGKSTGTSSATSTVLMYGLFALLSAAEKAQDERSLSLKASSTFAGFFFGYTIKLVTSYLYEAHMITVQMTEINHFIILVLSLSTLIFYYRLYFTN